MVRLIPKDTSFFAMFSAMSNNLIDGARVMVDLFTDYKDVEKKIAEIRRIGICSGSGVRSDPADSSGGIAGRGRSR